MSMRSFTLFLCLTVALSACSSDPAPEASATPAEALTPTESNTPATTPAAPAAADRRPASATAAPAAPASSPRNAVTPTPAAPAAPARTMVPAGTEIDVLMIDSISTATNSAGDQFLASLAESLMVNGKLVADKGTTVRGRIVDAVGAGRVQGRASMRIVLTSIMDGQRAIPIVTEPIVTEAEGTRGRDAAVVGGAAAVGAAIGAIAGGKKGAGIGTIIGAGSGTGAVLATKGNEVEFGSESRLKFKLQETAELPTIAKKIS
jgi:hypothetical protein